MRRPTILLINEAVSFKEEHDCLDEVFQFTSDIIFVDQCA
jgi:hypothetical protein